MKNTIEFNQPINTSELASGYTLHHKTSADEAIQININGMETVTTLCPKCYKSFSMSFEDFIEIVAECGLYGTQTYCRQCGEKLQKESR